MSKTIKTRAPPLGVVALLVLLALASLGVVYGLWSKTLTIEGIVNTGRVHGRWDGAICSEFHDWPWPPEGFGEVDGKDVGSTDVFIDPDDNNLLHLVIDNAYPSYSVDCEVEYVNDGTIPWVIRGTTIEPVSPNLTQCTLSGNQTKTLECEQLTVILVDGIGAQIDPGDGVASSVRVHIEQPADQNAEYLFEIKICVAQWNESATFGECVAAAP